MSKLRQLIEAANRKCEMAWKVYSYNPEKDNELVDTSKAFDCIAAAQAHKRDILEKNPNYTVEIIAEAVAKARIDIGNDDIDDAYMDVNYAISRDTNYKLKDFKKEAANIDVKNPGVLEVPDGKKVDELPQSHFEKLVDKKGYAEVIRALTNLEVWNKDKNKSLSSWASNMADKLKKKYRPESIQYKFKVGDRVLYEGDKATIKELKTSGTGSLEKPYYSVEKDKEKGKMTHPAREFELKLIEKSSQKNEAYHASIQNRPSIQKIQDALNAYKPVFEITKGYDPHLYKFSCSEKDWKEAYNILKKFNCEKLNWNPSLYSGCKGVFKFIYPYDIKESITNTSGIAKAKSAQKSESKVNMSKLKNEIQVAVNKYFKNDKDLLEYVHIDTMKDKLGRDILEVRAELGYDDMVKLADYLDKIVTKYDKYAYFDQETSGIMTAVFESTQKNEDYKNPKNHDELKLGEWYKFKGNFIQIADRQPIDNEIQYFPVFPDLHVGNSVHAAYKSFFKPTDFTYVDKREHINKAIKERESQIAKLKAEIESLKKSI